MSKCRKVYVCIGMVYMVRVVFPGRYLFACISIACITSVVLTAKLQVCMLKVYLVCTV